MKKLPINRRIFEASVRYFNSHENAKYVLLFIYKFLPLSMFIAFPILLAFEFLNEPHELLKLVMVPLWVFVAVTIMRFLVNEERPYEQYGMPSVFHKETSGKSFPSRHTACAFIIAMAFLYVSPPWGIWAMIISVLIEVSRILAGVHYVHDVVAGMLISLGAGWLFFFIL